MTPPTSPPPPNGKDIDAPNDADKKTEVWYGIEYTINRTVQGLSQVKNRFDNCGDVRHPSIIVTTEPVKKAFIDVKNRGIKTRFITEITKDNLHYCKELMQVVSEVRHLDGVKGNFAVGESFYAGYAIGQEANMLINMAEGEGLSINSKINSILWKYMTFYKYVKQDSSLIIPSRSAPFFIENIDEGKWIEEYNDTLEEIVPFFS